ncbi:MAG: hypothetical protein HKN12_03905 [Gemmatimonadetes bacterium]|nr:hypothetical protein [Gemmatimonadota bacterium]
MATSAPPRPRRGANPRNRATGRSTPRRQGLPPLVFGGLLLLGGVALWVAISPPGSGSVPEVWDGVADEAVATDGLRTEVRPGGGVQGDLLRLEWPEHPRAEKYQIRFRDSGGSGPAPVTVSGTVFLYDLKSNALRLPEKFTWEVSAVLPDGSEIVTPRQGFAE